jgi:hypothetical protein
LMTTKLKPQIRIMLRAANKCAGCKFDMNFLQFSCRAPICEMLLSLLRYVE